MPGNKETSKQRVDSLIEAARKLRDSDAFAPAINAQAMQNFSEVHRARIASKRSVRQTLLFGLVLVLAVCGMSLCLPYYGVDSMGVGGNIYSPGDVLDSYVLWFQMNVMPLFDATLSNRTGAMLAAFEQSHPNVIYQLVMQRGVVTLCVIACGILLAVSGMLFQTSFRNPLATPTALGVSEGVSIGAIIFAFSGYTAVGDNMPLYLLLVYGGGAIAVVFVIVMSRLVSGRHFNVFDMLLLGTVVCQLLGGVTSYVTTFGMDIDTWERFYEIQQAGDMLSYPLTWAVVGIVFVATIIPVWVMRFKLNLVSFSDEEGRLMGVRPRVLRAVALGIGSIMQLAAIASIGQVAMLSLAVPFLIRYLMPAEFRYQLLGNCILGIIVLLTCVAFQHFAIIGSITVPVGTLVSVLVVPFFVWAVAIQSQRWGD
jgi:iron complex transport system permease protein